MSHETPETPTLSLVSQQVSPQRPEAGSVESLEGAEAALRQQLGEYINCLQTAMDALSSGDKAALEAAHETATSTVDVDRFTAKRRADALSDALPALDDAETIETVKGMLRGFTDTREDKH